eukprot:14765301-Ditylum_brightwellii.AAC.1
MGLAGLSVVVWDVQFALVHDMCPYSQQPLLKIADFILELPAGHIAWPSHCHKPLLIAICFSFLVHRPYQLRGPPALLGLDRNLHQMQKEDESPKGDQADDEKCMVGRDRDWTCALFQCDWYWFQNLQDRNLVKDSAADKRLLHYIRKVNLDICWAQA